MLFPIRLLLLFMLSAGCRPEHPESRPPAIPPTARIPCARPPRGLVLEAIFDVDLGSISNDPKGLSGRVMRFANRALQEARSDGFPASSARM